jgi:hypothetical protein
MPATAPLSVSAADHPANGDGSVASPPPHRPAVPCSARDGLKAVLSAQLRDLPSVALSAAIALALLDGSSAVLELVITEAANRLPSTQP